MMSSVRTTLRIDAELLDELRERARQDGTSLTRLANRLLRLGLGAQTRRPKRFVEKPLSLGRPTMNLDKALGVAGAIEDDEVIRKIALRK